MWAKYQQTPKHSGFTIVELLIVIVVIGILAAITIVAYNGVSQRATAAAVTSDLSNAAKQFKVAQVTDGVYPTSVPTSSSGTTYQVTVDNTANPQNFCITGTKGTTSYEVTESTSPTAGGCPGHGTGGVAAVTNLATNPSVETDTSSWGVRWFGANGGAGTTARTSAAAYKDGSGYRKTWTTAGGGQDVGFQYAVPITAGKPYTFSVYTRCSVATAHRRFVNWTDGSGTQIGSTGTGTETSIPANTWQRLSITATAPSGASSASFVWGPYPGSGSPGSSVGETLDADAVMVTEGSTLYNYADGNSSNWVWNGTANSSTSTGPAV